MAHSKSLQASPESERIRALGARVTPARVDILRLLEQADHAMSHRDVEEVLHDAYDRVTIYRVLEWLVDQRLAHRVADSDRVFRFSSISGQKLEHGQHAHFRCEACGKVYCLDEVMLPVPHLPEGFSGHSVEYNISGQCPACERRIKKEK